MVKRPAYTAADRIELFRTAFHDMSEKDYWPQLRRNSHIGRVATGRGMIDWDTGLVSIESSPISDLEADLISSNVRKFTSLQDPAYVGDVLAALEELGAEGMPITEAQSQWRQITAKRFDVVVDQDGQPVGVLVPGLPERVHWLKGVDVSTTSLFQVSMHDCMDVYFNEKLFHTFEPGRREAVRSVVRALPQVWQKHLARTGMVATVFCAILLHHQAGMADDRWECDGTCQEKRIMDGLHQQ